MSRQSRGKAADPGGGFLSPGWVALQAIEQAIEKAPKDRPLSAWTLQPLFRGKSVNTPAFLLAALVQEKWLRVLKGKKRGVEVVDPTAFQTKIKRLTGTAPKSPGKKPAPAKTKAPARRKK